MPRCVQLSPDDYKIQRWKNGRGTTSQLLIEPADAVFPIDAFRWRISSARVNAAGAFSLFPGYDRLLVLVEGRGLDLGSLARLSPFESVRFEGEREVDAHVASGEEILDYGLMWKRGEFEVFCEVMESSGLQTLEAAVSGPRTLVVTALGGGVSIQVGGASHTLAPWETLRIDFSAAEASKDWQITYGMKEPSARAIVSRLERPKEGRSGP